MSFDIKTNLNPPNANTFNPYSLEIKDGILINVHHKNWNGPIVIPEDAGIHTIGARAFSNCQCNMISIPESVKYLGDNAFINCGNLQRVDKIGEFAHNGVGDRPFEGIHHPVDINTQVNGKVNKGFVKESNLRDAFIDNDESKQNFGNAEKFIDNIVEKPKTENYYNLASQFKNDPQPPLSMQNENVCIKNGVLVNCNPVDKTLSIPEGVHTIGIGATAYCYNTTILAPTTLTSIGDYNLDNNLKLDCTIMTPQAIADLVNNYPKPNELLNHLTQESQNKAFPYLSTELKNEIISNSEYDKQALGDKLSGISFSKGEYDSYTGLAIPPDEKQVQADKLNEARFSEQQYDDYTGLAIPKDDNQIRSDKLTEKSFRDSQECVNTDYLNQVFVTKEPLGLNDFKNFPEHSVSEPVVEFSFRSPTVQDNDLII